MTGREKMSTQAKTSQPELLTEESKQTLIGYHKVQMKRDQLINPAEEAIIPLLDLLDDVRAKWKYAEDRLRAAEERSERFETYNIKLNEDLKLRKEKEREQAGQISMLQTDKSNLEEAVRDYERRIALIKKMLHQNLDDTVAYDKIINMRPPKMPAVSRPLSPIESDATMDSNEEVKLRFNRHYRRSQSVEPAVRKSRTTNSKRIRASQFNYIDEEESENNENNPPNDEPKNKRSKSGRIDEITTVTTITMDISGRQPTRGSIEVRKSGGKKRSVSASRILDDNSARRQLIQRPGRIINAPSSVDLRHKTPTALGGSWTHGNAISDCRHRFNDYRALLGSCGVCNRQITFMAKGLQCEVCKICIHAKCRKGAPVPCLPPASFPTPGRNAESKLPLRGYCPNAPPYIPALLIRCICELEKNRLGTEGIYRIPGNREDTNRLYKEFNNSNYIPNLSSEATEVITSCIKLFLKKLKDSLIPRSSYNEFMKADDDDKLAEALGELPDPNRDTLAYLCLHLQKVAMNAAQNKMTIENLAAVLCPTILGNNAELNTLGYAGGRNVDPIRNDPFEEVARQRIVLERLLKMSSEFWSDYLNTRTCSQAFTPINTTPKTHRVPATCPANTRNPSTGSSGRADCSVLGPVSSTPPQNFTPRFAGSRRIEPLF